MAINEREAFEGLVELGQAVGELGVSLSEAQWRMDRATIDVALERAEALRRALPHAPELADALARERTVFYAVPAVEVRLQSTVSVTRTRGGLVRMLLGGARSSTQETTSAVHVTLAAVPATAALSELLEARAVELQAALAGWLRAQGFFGPASAARLREHGLSAGDVQDVPPSGDWSDPDWRRNLRAFKLVWNRRLREAPEELALLPENDLPDRAAFAVLDELSAGAAPAEDRAWLQEQARVLLAALSPEDHVHDPARGFARGEWTRAWSDLHRKALRELNQGAAEPLPETTEPTAATVAALRKAWEAGRRVNP